MDSCMGKLEGGGYEILILMEYCGGMIHGIAFRYSAVNQE